MYPNEYVKNLVSNIPFSPGVYQMKDEDGQVIYVGKAISLRKRVRQYFQKNNKSKRIENMVKLIRDIEYIVTKNEAEALVLECNYIKQKSPKFNVMLKDDKTYPYVNITIKEKYPSIFITRRKIEDGNLYFGPYTDVAAIKETIRIIKETFPIRRCKNIKRGSKNSPCLYYYIGRCLGPCSNLVNDLEYKKMIDQIINFLQGKQKDLVKSITEEMNQKIESLEFEKAAILKKRLDSINKVYEKQEVANLNEINSDIVGYILNDGKLHVQIFKIRNHKIVLNDNINISEVEKDEIEDNLLSIISRYYLEENRQVPKKIYIKLSDENIETLQEFFKLNEFSVSCIVPKKGQKLNLIKMVENNIKINIENSKNNAVYKLAELLNIEPLNSIECFDISNLRNDYIVGCMIRYEDGKLNKSMYRKYKIKSTLTQDDPKCMAEVISRRINRKDEWNLPDLILVDGGKTQLSKVKEKLKESIGDVPIYGMVKNDKHRTRALMDIDGNEISIEQDKSVFNFITFLQDEIHRFTISYHRQLRDKIKE